MLDRKIYIVHLHVCWIKKNLALLDSDSINTIFYNPDYVNNIRKVINPLILNANRGPLITDQVCDVLCLEIRWCNPN